MYQCNILTLQDFYNISLIIIFYHNFKWLKIAPSFFNSKAPSKTSSCFDSSIRSCLFDRLLNLISIHNLQPVLTVTLLLLLDHFFIYFARVNRAYNGEKINLRGFTFPTRMCRYSGKNLSLYNDVMIVKER